MDKSEELERDTPTVVLQTGKFKKAHTEAIIPNEYAITTTKSKVHVLAAIKIKCGLCIAIYDNKRKIGFICHVLNKNKIINTMELIEALKFSPKHCTAVLFKGRSVTEEMNQFNKDIKKYFRLRNFTLYTTSEIFENNRRVRTVALDVNEGKFYCDSMQTHIFSDNYQSRLDYAKLYKSIHTLTMVYDGRKDLTVVELEAKKKAEKRNKPEKISLKFFDSDDEGSFSFSTESTKDRLSFK